jgi:hypothetical protein
MTPKSFFSPTYPTHDPTVNFPFNFLNFHSDTLICHLLFLCIILTHSFAICYVCAHHSSRPHLPPYGGTCIKELILCNILFGNPVTSPPINPTAHTCCTSPPRKRTSWQRGNNAPLTINYSHPNSNQAPTLYIHKSLTKNISHCAPPSSQLGAIHKSSTFENLIPVDVSFIFVSHAFQSITMWLVVIPHLALCCLACMPLPVSCNLV